MTIWDEIQKSDNSDVPLRLHYALLQAQAGFGSSPGPRDEEIVALLAEQPALARRVVKVLDVDASFREGFFSSGPALRVLGKAHQSGLEHVLLSNSANLSQKLNDTHQCLLLIWRDRVGDDYGTMRVAAAVAEGVEAVMDRLSSNYLHRQRVPRDLSELGSGTAHLVALAMLSAAEGHRRHRAWSYDLDAEGVRAAFHALVARSAVQWAYVLPWLLQILPADCDELIDGTILAYERNPSRVTAALDNAVRHPIERIQLRATGLKRFLDNSDGNEVLSAYASMLARRMDLSSVFPRPLGQPSSTWLSSLDLEASFENAVRAATDRFAEEFMDWARAEEEGHVARLMTRIQAQLEQQAKFRSAGRQESSAPAGVVGSYRPVPKSEEKNVGADLALVISIEVHQKLNLEFAEFVQVKKSHETTTLLSNERWRISVAQIEDVLRASSTASYWLICADGSILVLPAKLVQAKANARTTHGKSFTLKYEDVRHAVIDLPNYLTQLAVGAWIGSTDANTVRLARGNGEFTRARAVFEMKVTYSPLDERFER
ncbi:hypothetical protein ACWIGI_28795 [Nocardia sp. NPDC055321]